MTTKKATATPATTAAKKAPVKKTAAPAKPSANPTGKLVAKPAGSALPKQAPKKPEKERKVKVVRDSFTMPQNEYQKIADIKESCLEQGLRVKKSEVLRAGLQALSKLGTAQLKSALNSLTKIKTGRPKKD